MVNYPIRLDMACDLPKVRQSLSLITDNMAQCLYSSPCAVGVMMTPDQRQQLVDSGDDIISIDTLIEAKQVVVPEGQQNDFQRLQSAFDRADLSGFTELLAELESKYLARSA